MYLLLSLSITDLNTRGFCHLVNTLTSIESIIRLMILTKLTSIQKRSLSYVQLVFHLYHY